MPRAKKAVVASPEPEQAFHYFATTGIGWGSGPTLDAAMQKLATVVKGIDSGIIRRMLGRGGVMVWTCRVELPPETHYSIRGPLAFNEFKPERTKDGQRVPISEGRHWALLTDKGTAIEVDGQAHVLNEEERR